jgi:hypothetical protein
MFKLVFYDTFRLKFWQTSLYLPSLLTKTVKLFFFFNEKSQKLKVKKNVCTDYIHCFRILYIKILLCLSIFISSLLPPKKYRIFSRQIYTPMFIVLKKNFEVFLAVFFHFFVNFHVEITTCESHKIQIPKVMSKFSNFKCGGFKS